jgi:hypothetical protein
MMIDLPRTWDAPWTVLYPFTVVVGVSSLCGDFGVVRPLYLVFITHESGQHSILISSVIQSLLYEYVLSQLN